MLRKLSHTEKHKFCMDCQSFTLILEPKKAEFKLRKNREQNDGYQELGAG